MRDVTFSNISAQHHKKDSVGPIVSIGSKSNSHVSANDCTVAK